MLSTLFSKCNCMNARNNLVMVAFDVLAETVQLLGILYRRFGCG